MIIGAGAIARAHAKAAAKLNEPVLIGVTDPSAEAIKQFKAEFPQANVFPTARDMLAAPAGDNDIVINATPPHLHMGLTIEAMRSGRHVLCEKPLALDEDQARTMLAVSEENGRLLGCCSTRLLGTPAAEKVRQLVGSGALGDLYHVSFINRLQRSRSGIEHQQSSRWFLDQTKSGGGVIMDWGPYDIAALMELFRPIKISIASAWLARPVTEVDPIDIPLETEQHFAAQLILHLTTGQKLPVTYERSACTHGASRNMVEIEGTTGSVAWDWPGSEGRVTHAFDHNGQIQTESDKHPDLSGLHPHDKPLHFFLKAVRGESSPAIIGRQAIFNFACLGAIYTAAKTLQPQTVPLT
jgi:predicted dehydrogenase